MICSVATRDLFNLKKKQKQKLQLSEDLKSVKSETTVESKYKV